MWIEEKANGKYKFIERYTDYLTGQKKRVSITLDKNTAQSRKLAQRTLNEMISASYANTTTKEYTLKELIEAYQKEQMRSVKQSTYKRNFHACNTIAKMLGKHTLVSRLSAQYVKERFLSTGKSPGTLNEHLKRFKALIRWGYQNDYVDDISFLDKIGTFKDVPHKVKIQDKYLESAEVKKLLAAMTEEIWRCLTEFLILSGLRFGEAVALLKEDVDFKQNLIHVTKTFDAVNQIVTTPKTLCSIRDVYMQPELARCCHKLNELMLRRKLMHGIAYTGNRFLFSKNGDFIHYYSYNKYLRENTEKVLGRSLTAHALRHTHASLLLEKGISIDVISRRLGHENSKVTREIYLHVTERLKEKDNEQIAQISFL